MSDQIIDAAAAQGLHTYATRIYPQVGWIVMRDQAEYSNKFVARLTNNTPTPYILLADSIAALHAQLPPGLVRSERQPVDPPEVVEMWFVE
jgi:hypothetical protein